ncbi:MAG: hypothetical protein ABJA32_10700, partial [Ginsengibacter sp.]
PIMHLHVTITLPIGNLSWRSSHYGENISKQNASIEQSGINTIPLSPMFHFLFALSNSLKL